MNIGSKKSAKAYALKPSSSLTKHFEEISSYKGPILDVPSGSGRNSLFFQARGCHVVCVDNNLTALQSSLELSQRMPPYQNFKAIRTRLREESRLFGLTYAKGNGRFDPTLSQQ